MPHINPYVWDMVGKVVKGVRKVPPGNTCMFCGVVGGYHDETCIWGIADRLVGMGVL